MENSEQIKKLITLSQKPLSGFEVKSELNKLIIKVKPKTLVFGCLILFFIALSVFLFFYIDTKPTKFVFVLAPAVFGFISLVSISKSATQTCFDFGRKQVTIENSNFIGKLFNKPQKIEFKDITNVEAHQEVIKNNNSAGGTTGRNYVYTVYLITNNGKRQIFTVNKNVLTKADVDNFAEIVKSMII